MTPRHKEDTPLSPTPNDTVIRQEHAGSDGPLLADTFQSGVIESWIPGTFTALVTLGGPSPRTVPATWFAGIMASAHFGLTVGFHPEAGTTVKLVKDVSTETYFIVGAFQPGNGTGYNRSDAGLPETLLNRGGPLSEYFKGKTTQQRGNFAQMRNRVGGEGDMLNAADTGIQFLRNLVRMKASDLAFIECSLMDDLVRIVSENYSHVSALGEHRIMNDGGRPTAIWEGSSKWYETMGESSPDAVPDLDTDDPFLQGARTRFQQYLGHLGNIFHMFVSDPAEALGQFAAGRFRAHVNEDGSLLVQTVGDLIFEKAVAIQVPAKQFVEDDPEGDHLIDMEWTESPELQTWSPADPDNLYYEAYKLRDYARWMNNWFSLAQFHRSRKDYKVPGEAEAPQPSHDNEDQERPNTDYAEAHSIYLTRYSTIRMFRDGSVLLLDGYNSSLHMGGGDVTLSAARHLRLEAAGDVITTAGRDVITTAYRHLDLGTVIGGLTMRGKRWLKMLVDGGKFLLEQKQGDGEPEEGEDEDLPGIQVRSLDGHVGIAGGQNDKDVLITSERGLVTKSKYILNTTSCVINKTLHKIYTLLNTTKAIFNTNALTLNGTIDATQINVRRKIPIPIGGERPDSLVQVDEDSDTEEDLEEAVEAEDIEDLEAAYTPPPGQLEFKYAEDREGTEFPQSVTQAEIQPDETVNASELIIDGDVRLAETAHMQMQEYIPTNSPMNEPASSNLKNTKSGPMKPVTWQFKRIPEESNDN